MNDPSRATIADVNGDGKTDVIASRLNDVAVLLGNGNGTFRGEQYFDTGGGPYSVVFGDFNGDGKVDLAAADHDASTVSVLFGNGNGTFQAKHTLSTGNTPYTIAVGDFDGNGVNDLMTTNEGANTVSVLLGNGTTGTTTTTVTSTTTTTTTGTTTVTTDCLLAITGVSLATQADAILAQGQIQGYQAGVSVVSGAIGAVLSRFQMAVNITTSIADTYKEAEARITNVDVATDVATLVRKQIIQQAATAMLAQANQQPELALTLLRG